MSQHSSKEKPPESTQQDAGFLEVRQLPLLRALLPTAPCVGQWDLLGAETVKPVSKACDESGVRVLPPELMAKLCHMRTRHLRGKSLNSLNNLKW